MKKWISLIFACLLLFSCTACGQAKTGNNSPDTTANPLTGLPLHDAASVNRRPVAVMLNNIHLAMPQHGVSAADIIYEYNVEGDITRMIGFFQEPEQVGVIGSVRSARPCFIETALGMDAIYVHAGGSNEAYQMLYDLEIDDIDEPDLGCFWRDEERAKTMDFEHTLMTSGEKIWDYVSSNGWRTDHAEDYHYPAVFTEDGTPQDGTAATEVSVEFSPYKTGTFTYDPDSKLYQIGQYGGAYIDGNTGEQVGVTNLLVLRTSVVNSGDKAGHMNIDIQGSGEGTYFCGGKATDIQWHKETMDAPFTYTLPDGSALPLGIGRTYVCVVDHGANVQVSGT